MLIKFTRAGRGEGGGRKLANYLQGELDHAGKEREAVHILRGDPDSVGEIADGLKSKNKFVHSIIAWAPTDQPTTEQIDQVLDTYESVVFAGIDPQRYAWSAVRHDDSRGGVHVHIMMARVDLSTGIYLSLIQPGWQLDIDPITAFYNEYHGWADPADPARARPQQPGYEAMVKANHPNADGSLTPINKESITDYVRQHINAGLISDRHDVITCLEDVGEITRIGENYISVLPEGAKRAIRLKGTYYEHDFQPNNRPDPAPAQKNDRKVGTDRKPYRSKLNQLRDEIKAAFDRRRSFHVKRLEQADRNRSNHSIQALVSAADSWPEPVFRPVSGQRNQSQGIDINDRRPGPDTGSSPADHADNKRGRDRSAPEQERTVSNHTTQHFKASCLHYGTIPRPMDNQNTRGLNDDDRTGNQTIKRSQSNARRSNGNTGRGRPALQAFDTANTQLQQRTTEFINQVARFGNAIIRISQAVKATIDMILKRNQTLEITGHQRSDNPHFIVNPAPSGVYSEGHYKKRFENDTIRLRK